MSVVPNRFSPWVSTRETGKDSGRRGGIITTLILGKKNVLVFRLKKRLSIFSLRKDIKL